MKKSFLTVAIMLVFLISSTTFAAASYYEGKTIRIIVGHSAGGGYDTNARAIARHLGRHIPGKPTVTVENMTGAGGLISASYMYRIAKPDGLTLGSFNGGLFFNQVMGQPGVEFDARKFIFIGSYTKQKGVLVFTKKSGITSMEKLMASPVPVKMGGLAPGNDADNITRLMRAVANLPVKIVEGYKGTTEIRLAMEQGEIAGSCLNWISTRSAWSKVLQKGDAVVVVQAVAEPISDLPNVPLSINYAKTDEARQLIEAGIHSPGIFARPFLLPPGTPMEQTKILTGAFRDTMNDKEFLADAKKSKLDIDPIGAADLEKAVASIFKLDSAMLGKLKDILFK